MVQYCFETAFFDSVAVASTIDARINTNFYFSKHELDNFIANHGMNLVEVDFNIICPMRTNKAHDIRYHFI